MSVQSRPDGVFPREVGVSGQRPVEFLAQAAAAASPAQQQTGWDAVRTARQAIQGFDTGGLTATDLHNARRALVDSMGSGLPKPLQENQESMLGQIDRRLQAQQAQAARQAEARNQQGAQLVRDLRESIGGFDRGAVSAQSLRDARTQANDFLAANQGRLNQTTEANLRSFLAQSKTRLDNAAQTGQQQQAARQLNASLNTHVTTLRDAIQAYDRAPNAGTRRALNDAAHEANAFAGRIRNDQVDQLSTAGIENLSSYRAQAMRRLEASSPQRPAPAPAAAGGATAAAGAGRDRYGEPEMIQTFQSGRWRGREVAVYQVQNRESGAWEVRAQSLQPNRIERDVLVFSSNRRVNDADFGREGQILPKLAGAAQALNAPGNIRPGAGGGPAVGSARDAAVGVGTGIAFDLPNMVVGLPEGLFRNAVGLSRNVADGLERLVDVFDPADRSRQGPSNPLEFERRAQFSERNNSQAALSNVQRTVAQGLGANPDSLTFKIGELVGGHFAPSPGGRASGPRPPADAPRPDLDRALRTASLGDIKANLDRIGPQGVAQLAREYPTEARQIAGRLRDFNDPAAQRLANQLSPQPARPDPARAQAPRTQTVPAAAIRVPTPPAVTRATELNDRLGSAIEAYRANPGVATRKAVNDASAEVTTLMRQNGGRPPAGLDAGTAQQLSQRQAQATQMLDATRPQITGETQRPAVPNTTNSAGAAVAKDSPLNAANTRPTTPEEVLDNVLRNPPSAAERLAAENNLDPVVRDRIAGSGSQGVQGLPSATPGRPATPTSSTRPIEAAPSTPPVTGASRPETVTNVPGAAPADAPLVPGAGDVAAPSLIRPARTLNIQNGQDLQARAQQLRQLPPEERAKVGNAIITFLNRDFGALPSRIDDIHSHEGANLFIAEAGPGFGAYDPRNFGQRPPGMSDKEWTNRTVDRFREQADRGQTVFFPVAPIFNPGTPKLDGDFPDYYLARNTRNETLMGRVRIEGNRVVNDSTMIDRYGDPAIVPFSIPKDDFEELIGRPIPNGVETLEFVATPRGCQLHFGGPEVDRNLIRSHVTMIKNERERYGTDIIAERYVLGLTSGNPRAENSYYDVYESIGIANEVETAEGLERGTSKLVRGETNLSKEIVHALGGQTPLAWNTQREMDNMAEWAGAMGQTGMPVIIHVDSGLPAQANLSTVGQGLTGFKMHSDLGNVDRFIEFARNAPDTDIVWAHAGLGFTVEMPPNYTDTLQRVLDAAPNVKIDISWDAIHRYIAEDPDAWARFIVRNEDRIIFGSDTIGTSQNPAPNSRMNVAEGLRRTGLVEAMDRIDPDGSAVEKLFSGNYQATITPGVDRVNEFRTHPENVAWLERRGYESGEPPPYIWARDDDGNYLPNLIRNPALPPEQ